jgi:hypothetical protein
MKVVWWALLCALILLSGNNLARAADCEEKRPAGTPTASKMPSQSELTAAPYLNFTMLSESELLIWGGVCINDAPRVESFLNTLKGLREISFISPGGSLGTGLDIGRIIRKRRITTRIRANTTCASSCNFMFLGGEVRYVEPGGRFVVHMFSSGGLRSNDKELIYRMGRLKETVDDLKRKDPTLQVTTSEVAEFLITKRIKEIQQESAQISAVIARFLVEMQLSLRFLTTFANIANDDARPLTRDELKSFTIMNIE